MKLTPPNATSVNPGGSRDGLLARLARWTRSERRPISQLDVLRAGGSPRRSRYIERWFPHRQFLLRSRRQTAVFNLGPRLQIAAVAGCLLAVTGFLVTALVAAWEHRLADQMAREVETLRSTASHERERAAEDRDLLRRLGQELARAAFERDRAAATVSATGKTLAERQQEIERLTAEREAAIDRAIVERIRLIAEREAAVDQVAAERSRLIAEREAAVHRAVAERLRLVGEHKEAMDRAEAERERVAAERDKALAERDEALGANRDTLVRLNARTQRTIGDVERIIASTGLDLGRVVKVPTTRVRAAPRGGPFIPWEERPFDEAADTQNVESVSSDLDRLQVLLDALRHLPMASPMTRMEISGLYGFRVDPFNGRGALHEGIDMRALGDNAVNATAAGTVAFAGWKAAFGNTVEIDHGFGVSTRYAHLSRLSVRAGDAVAARQPVGVIGATGRVTGAHLHYEVRVDGKARNPLKFLGAQRHVQQAAEEDFAGFGHAGHVDQP